MIFGCILKSGQDSARETVGKKLIWMEQHVLRPRIRREGSCEEVREAGGLNRERQAHAQSQENHSVC